MKKERFLYITKWILAFVLVVTIFPLQTIVFAEEKSVATFKDLKEAIETSNTHDTIVITQDIGIESTLSIADKALTIRSEGNVPHTLKRGTNVDGTPNQYLLFSVEDRASLILENITIDGEQLPNASTTRFSLIDNHGYLELGQGTTLKNNNINVPVYAGGGAIYNCGQLLMKDGAYITNCSLSYGGAAIGNEGSFIMEGGLIEGNGSGSGNIYNLKTASNTIEFRMSGGSILGNIDPSFEESLRGAVFNDGNDIPMWIGKDAHVGDIGIDTSRDHHLRVFEKLNQKVAVYVDANAGRGKIIAIGDNYTLTEEDKDKLVVNRGTLRLDASKNAILLDFPDPIIDDMLLSTDSLGNDNHNLKVTLKGKDMSWKMLVSAFHEGVKTDIEAYTYGKSDEHYADLLFPENNTKKEKEYTIKLSLDDGVTWHAIEKNVKVISTPAKAYWYNNRYTYSSINPSTTPILVEAIGDRQNELGILKEDQRYLPKTLQILHTDFSQIMNFEYVKGSYMVELPLLPVDNYNVHIIYSYQKFDGSKWMEESTYTLSGNIQVNGIRSMDTDKDFLSSNGEDVEVTIKGVNIPYDIVVKAFDDSKPTNISGYRYDYIDSTTRKAMLSIPENTGRKPKVYTLKISQDNGITWENIEKKITVAGKPIMADQLHNAYTIEPNEITTFSTIRIEAIGDRQNVANDESIIGDQRYIPSSCGPNNTPFYFVDNAYVAEFKPSSSGRVWIEIKYSLEEFDGSNWQYVGEDIKYAYVDVMSVSGIQLDKPELSYTGEKVGFEVIGSMSLEKILVKAFDAEGNQDIEVYVEKDAFSTYKGTLDIPANMQRYPKTYHVMVSLDNGVNWEPIESQMITVAAHPSLAYAENNTFRFMSNAITSDTVILVEAFGDRQNANDTPIQGDQRYIPIFCNSTSFYFDNDVYIAQLSFLPAGEHTIEVTYELQQFNGYTWINIGEDKKNKKLKVMSYQGIQIDKKHLPYTGEKIQVVVQGEYLENALIEAFDENGATGIREYVFKTANEYRAQLIIPENKKRIPKLYTIKVSFDDGVTWQDKEEQISVAPKPIRANAFNNSFTITPRNITDTTIVTIQAMGDRQGEVSAVAEDQRYIPIYCVVEGDDKNWIFFTYKNGGYYAEIKALPLGDQNVVVAYALEEFDGSTWKRSTQVDTKYKNVSVSGIRDIRVNKDNLFHTGDIVQVHIDGEYLKDVLIRVFDEQGATDIKVNASTKANGYNASIVFPKNTTRAVKIYTIKASLDKGKTWVPIEKKITVAAQPILAKAKNNSIHIASGSLTPQSVIVIEAIGDRQGEAGIAIGDERYIPIKCNDIKFQYQKGKFYAELSSLPEGTNTIVVEYALESFNGTAWIATGKTDNRSMTIEISKAESNIVLTLAKTKLTLVTGESQTLEYHLLPEHTTIPIIWKSLDPSIANVDDAGNVQAIKTGITRIQVSTQDGTYMAECEIIVLDKQIEKAPSHNGIVETGANSITLVNRQYLYSILLFGLFLKKKRMAVKLKRMK